MPGDRMQPIDGKILIQAGGMNAEGIFEGCTVAYLRDFLNQQVPELNLGSDTVARVTTMDNKHETWRAINNSEELSMMFLQKDWGVQIYQGYAKLVPDDYVIRREDILIKFLTPEQLALEEKEKQ